MPPNAIVYFAILWLRRPDRGQTGVTPKGTGTPRYAQGAFHIPIDVLVFQLLTAHYVCIVRFMVAMGCPQSRSRLLPRQRSWPPSLPGLLSFRQRFWLDLFSCNRTPVDRSVHEVYTWSVSIMVAHEA